MKKKIIFVIVMFLVSISTISCGKSNSRDGAKETTGDSIVIDENTKETLENDSGFKISQIAKTEVVTKSGTREGNCFISSNGKIIRYHDLYNEGKSILEKLEIGSVSEKRDEEQGVNLISWQEKDLGENYFEFRMEPFSGKILMFNNKEYYSIDKEGELKELTPNLLVQNINNGLDVQNIRISEDKSAVIYNLGYSEIMKMCIVDLNNNSYYEIEGEVLENFSRCIMKVLAIEGNKIYMALYNSSDYSVTVGYFENNNFYDIVTFSDKNDIKIQITGNILYSNNRLLFLGLVEEKMGIYNYDLKNKNLSPELITESANEDYHYINMNSTKDKIIIQGADKADIFKRSINIASIDKNLEISNIKNIATTSEQSEYKRFEGWADNGEEFYIRNEYFNTGIDGSTEYETSFEVYKISN